VGLRRLLFDHPLVKTIGLGLFGVLGNVFAGAYIFEITKTVKGVQVLDWADTAHSRSFWVLVVVLILMGIYGREAARYESRIRKGVSEANVLDIALGELLGPMIEVAKRDIKHGRLRSMEEVKKIFVPGTGGGQS
jgi:hypothetical protein